jgi:negative regulator of sigma-B (phosphoserine phosphatase)
MMVAGWHVGAAVRSASGHECGGDRAIVRELDDTVLLAIIDVLGHGEAADAVARVAEEFLANAPVSGAVPLLRQLDARIAGSVGAAAGIATLTSDPWKGDFAGIGNTVFRILGKRSTSIVSVDGVVGQRAMIPKATAIRLHDRETILMHSDGISSRIDWGQYPEIWAVDVELAAQEIIRKFGRSYDDVACIVARPAR